jgi:predicted Rossmann fold flavoprotein
MTFDAIVIGGGAAGLFAAAEAGKRGLRVVVLERNSQPGRKILISGGGRCNFTNIGTSPENFISAHPHFARSALARYTPEDFAALVKSHHIPFYEKKLGQLFCRTSSRAIVDMLLAECGKARARVEVSCEIRSVEKREAFSVDTSCGIFEAPNLIVACGGLSFPKVGATDLGYRLAEQFGIKQTRTRPSLVALVLKNASRHRELAGLSVDASVAAGGRTFRENILFTHRGLSGPAILQISNYVDAGGSISVDLLPEAKPADVLSGKSSVPLAKALGEVLPARLAASIAAEFLKTKRVADLSKTDAARLSEHLKNWTLEVAGNEGWDRAEVTLGGISTDELSSKTMEARYVPGLYFIGEVVDVTGWLGGYNFQWAWASAFAAGNAVLK